MRVMRVQLLRDGLVESCHRIHGAVVQANGRAVRTAGDAARPVVLRSAIKPFQALPLVEDGGIERFGLTGEELAVTTASHGGEPFHLDAVRRVLVKARVAEEALACGPLAPLDVRAAEALRTAGREPTRLHNNCSGKHAGMLALAVLHGWPLDGYHRLGHPVQARVLATLAAWAAMPPDAIPSAIDGCGLPTFALPLEVAARACARLSAAAARREAAPARLLAAMTAHPEYVAGTRRLCTDLMRVTSGRLWAKVGAEGCYCAGVPEAGIGVALKVEDGAWRAAEPALVALLHAVGLLADDEHRRLAPYAEPAILNTRGERVGTLHAVL